MTEILTYDDVKFLERKRQERERNKTDKKFQEWGCDPESWDLARFLDIVDRLQIALSKPLKTRQKTGN